MKKLASFDDKFILEKIYESKKLSDKFSTYIEECEMDYVHDILSCLSGCDYSFGICTPNWMNVKDSYDFTISVRKAINTFGGSEKIEKLLATANKLKGNNLFGYKVEQLKDAVFDWINGICDYIENVIFKIYRKDIDDDVINYLECFIMNYLDDVYVNNENKLVRLETL